MKTTLELPDELMRAVKIRAVHEGRRIKDVMADLIRYGLVQDDGESRPGVRARVQLPLVSCAHAARAEDEMTPDRVADLLCREDAPVSPSVR